MAQRSATTWSVACALMLGGLTALTARQEAPAATPAAKLKNPVPSTGESIAAGQATFMMRCQACHQPDLRGGLSFGLETPAIVPSLTDDEWLRGGTDGEIFDVIKNGVPPNFDMQAWAEQIEDKEIWNLVNFIRSRHGP